MKMKKNTALISTDRLHDLILREEELRKIKHEEGIPSTKTIIVEKGCGYRYEIKTDDECNLKLATDLRYAKKEITDLRYTKYQIEKEIIKLEKKIENLTSELNYTEEIIRCVKKMNYFTFRKWKKE
jgi:hypothetical protein